MTDIFNDQALRLLNTGLPNFESELIDRDELLEMYRTAQSIMQSNPENLREYQNAENVFYSCVRVVRCLCLPEEAKKLILNDNEYTLEALDQFKTAKRNYSYVLDLLE